MEVKKTSMSDACPKPHLPITVTIIVLAGPSHTSAQIHVHRHMHAHVRMCAQRARRNTRTGLTASELLNKEIYLGDPCDVLAGAEATTKLVLELGTHDGGNLLRRVSGRREGGARSDSFTHPPQERHISNLLLQASSLN